MLHIPTNCHSVQFSCAELNETIESGDIYDSEYRGGRLGVYTLSQHNVTFSHVKYSCPSMSVPTIGKSALRPLVNISTV